MKRQGRMSGPEEFRERMVKEDLAGQGITDPVILSAFMRVPREAFTPGGTSLREAYGNHPYPIGFGQTISQPFIVAYMIQLLDAAPGELVLEIGTGSGYQTAILAAMGMNVITVEVIPQLAARARRTLSEVMPGSEVRFIVADGYRGWPPAAPYDGIIVSAAPVSIPGDLQDQLSANGGRMVIPAGDWSQHLIVVKREGDRMNASRSLPVRFVPLVRSRGIPRGHQR
jgi:protein-L-isoaspartate(D-aspartate) O-methyltransferase